MFISFRQPGGLLTVIAWFWRSMTDLFPHFRRPVNSYARLESFSGRFRVLRYLMRFVLIPKGLWLVIVTDFIFDLWFRGVLHAFCGGMPSASYGDRYTVTTMREGRTACWDLPSPIVDVVLAPSTNEQQGGCTVDLCGYTVYMWSRNNKMAESFWEKLRERKIKKEK